MRSLQKYLQVDYFQLFVTSVTAKDSWDSACIMIASVMDYMWDPKHTCNLIRPICADCLPCINNVLLVLSYSIIEGLGVLDKIVVQGKACELGVVVDLHWDITT